MTAGGLGQSRDRIDAVAAELGSLVTADVPLAPLCTYKVGGSAALFATIESVDELERIRHAVAETSIDTLVIGKGSNLLVADAGFDGLVVRLGESFSEIVIDEATGTARLGAAALLPVAARRTAAVGLTGFEWAVGVPGSVGGAVRMNAGGHGSDVAANLVRVSLFDLRQGGPVEKSAQALALSYRSSSVAAHHLVLFAEVALEPGDPKRSEAEIREIVRWRRANQPGGQNAGSVFTNPPGASAGALIDQAGLKGFRVGSASVSDKHANFIQADPDGSADDVARLIAAVRLRIVETFGVELHCENLLIGFDDPSPSAAPVTGAVKDGSHGLSGETKTRVPAPVERIDDQIT